MNAVALVTCGYISRIRRILAQVPITPVEGQNLLVKALELPLPPTVTEALGIHQSDIIIRSAIIAAIADMRAQPWLLDYVFASLPRDELTMKDYGENEVDQAKKWFLKTDIPVFMNYRVDEAKFPCISIALMESVEAENTLGDVHYEPSEDTEAAWPVLAGPFNPLTYSAGTGIMKVPDAVGDALVIAPGMIVLDKIGREFEILDVLDKTTFTIKTGVVADFANAVIKSSKPVLITSLESLSFRETYNIGCHVQSEPVHLTFLHSIVSFILLRYKEALLEARGFERSVISSAQFERQQATEMELGFSRNISITGYVRNYWPKAVKPRLLSSSTLPSFEKPNETTTETAGNDDKDPSWLVEVDGIGVNVNK